VINPFRSYRHPAQVAFVAIVLFIGAFAVHAPRDAAAQLLPALGGERAGTSGFQFLKIPVDARSSSLGNSVVASADDASALFWNPALAAQLGGPQVGFYHTAYFVDVSLSMVAASYPVGNSGFTVGATLQTLFSGEMDVTTEFQPFGTGESFSLTDMALGLTVSQSLTDLFSYGVTARYLRESVIEVSASTVVFDLGVFYRVGDSGGQMAVAIRNFGVDAKPGGSIDRKVIATDPIVTETSFERITPPTTFHLAFMYELLRSSELNALQLSAELSNPSDHSENMNLGAEYAWNNMLMFRIGYRFGIEEYRLPGLGVGIRMPVGNYSFRFDYGFSELERLGTVHRFGFNISL